MGSKSSGKTKGAVKRTTPTLKKLVLETLPLCKCNAFETCKKLKIPYVTYQNWQRIDEQFAADVLNILLYRKKTMIEKAVLNLETALDNGEKWATERLLDCDEEGKHFKKASTNTQTIILPPNEIHFKFGSIINKEDDTEQ